MMRDGGILSILLARSDADGGAMGWLSRNAPEMLRATGEHLMLTFLAMAIACIIAIPIGIALTRSRSRLVTNGVLGLVSVIQPIPSLAMVALAMVLLYWLGLPSLGTLPAMVALTAYALLPVLRNTYTGIRQVDQSMVEVARGMGMRGRQILFQVELPLAVPFIMAGVRIATVWTIGVATLVSLVGAGGLGRLIFQGISNYNYGRILAGAIPAVLLALVLDFILGRTEDWLTPGGVESQGPN